MGLSRPVNAHLVSAWDVGVRMTRHVTVIAIQCGMLDHTRPVRRQALRIINSTAHITRRARPPYTELQVASNFSFLRGASHPHELVWQAAQLDYKVIGIFDHTRPVRRQALRITCSDAQRPRRARLPTGRHRDRNDVTQRRFQLLLQGPT